MSMHGRVILARMVELIDQCEAGRVKLPRLLEDLQWMYESLEPSEQPPERAWLDNFIPLDRVTAASSHAPHDQREMSGRIEAHLARLRRLINRQRPAA